MANPSPPSSRRSADLKNIVHTFGGLLLDNGRGALIPGPGHSRRDRSVSLRQLPDGRILIHCFSPKDDWRDVRDMLRGRDFARDASRDLASNPSSHAVPSFNEKIARARALWNEAVPIEGTLAATYLHARRIELAAWPASLRFLPSASSIDDRRRRPALIAAIMDPRDALQGVHINLLSPCGTRKADVATPRRTIGRLMGGAVRLHDDGLPSSTLLVAEGIETALSAAIALDLSAWAALTAGNLARFNPPPGTRRLIVAADRGAAGEAAGDTLARRMVQIALPTEIALAPDGCSDWNDWTRRSL